MLESRQLRYFLAVAEHLHYGRAADKLQIAQSALSRQVRELEEALGVRLLNRGRRSSISLTEPGKALLADGRIALQQLERAALSASRASRGELGRVAIGYVASAALCGLLPRALEQFRGGHAAVELQLQSMDTPTQLSALSQGLIDLGFLRPRRRYPPGICATVAHRETLVLALSSTHPLAKRRIDAKDLADQTFIVPQFDENDGFVEYISALGSAGGFEPQPLIRVRDFLTALTLAAAHYGVVLGPGSMLALSLPNVTFRRIHGFTMTAELAVAYPEKVASSAAQAFIKAAIQISPKPRERAKPRSRHG